MQCYPRVIEDMHLSNFQGFRLYGHGTDAMLLAARSVGLKTCILLQGIYGCDAIVENTIEDVHLTLIFNM
jgi:hypothetical protein